MPLTAASTKIAPAVPPAPTCSVAPLSTVTVARFTPAPLAALVFQISVPASTTPSTGWVGAVAELQSRPFTCITPAPRLTKSNPLEDVLGRKFMKGTSRSTGAAGLSAMSMTNVKRPLDPEAPVRSEKARPESVPMERPGPVPSNRTVCVGLATLYGSRMMRVSDSEPSVETAEPPASTACSDRQPLPPATVAPLAALKVPQEIVGTSVRRVPPLATVTAALAGRLSAETLAPQSVRRVAPFSTVRLGLLI